MPTPRSADDVWPGAEPGSEGGDRIGEWDDSPHPARRSGFELRRLRTSAEFDAAVTLQRQVWGESFSEVVPAGVLKVVQYVGGVAAGAFTETGELAGFVFGVSGIRGDRLSHWSDTLAVRAEFQNRGLGEDLKRYQRDLLLPLQVERVYWTFDPLESKNAYLNFARLGVVASEYRRDFYGATRSQLHDGIGTDRLVALWNIASERVVSRLAGDARHTGAAGYALDGVPFINATTDTAAGPRSGEPDMGLGTPLVLLTIPADIQWVKDRSADLAREWRDVTRAAFETYLARGYVARELVRDGPRSNYVLERGPA
ncbi:MAG: hypothetical protein ACYC2G_09450 [Gemmatimonadaceae bacterium]